MPNAQIQVIIHGRRARSGGTNRRGLRAKKWYNNERLLLFHKGKLCQGVGFLVLLNGLGASDAG